MHTEEPGHVIVQERAASKLGVLLKEYIESHAISMRQLSKSTGISAATISRIIAGKQIATVHHLQKLSQQLNLPVETFLDAMGVPVTQQPASQHDVFLDILQEIIEDFGMDLNNVVHEILCQLGKLEEYVMTREGRNVILNGFTEKMEASCSTGAIINKLNNFYAIFCAPDVSEEKRAAVGSALLYFILTVEAIPDYLFPIGYLDDAIAVKIVEKKILELDS